MGGTAEDDNKYHWAKVRGAAPGSFSVIDNELPGNVISQLYLPQMPQASKKCQVVNQLGRTPSIHFLVNCRNIGDRNEYSTSPHQTSIVIPIREVHPVHATAATTTTTATTNAKKQRRRHRKRNKNNTRTSLPRKSTFGIGERFSYRSIVTGKTTPPADRIKQVTPQNIPCRPSSQFKSTSPRFSRHPKAMHAKKKPTSPQEKQLQRIERKIQKYKHTTSSVADAYLQVLEESLTGFKHIDTEYEQLEQEKLTATSLTHNQRSCGRGTTGKRRPLSARVFRRRTKQEQPTCTSFGMGKQRTNQSYNTAMPNAWTQPIPKGNLMITPMQVKRPNVRSSASKNPRLNSSARRPFTTPLQARLSGGGDTCTGAEKESIVGVPTVIRLCQHEQKLNTAYPGLNKHKNIWRQQELKERLHNTNNGPPPPKTPASTSISLLRNTNNGIQPPNAAAAAAAAAVPVTKEGKRRPKSAGATKSRRRRKKIIRPRSAAVERRTLARTRAKMNQMKKRLYNYDDWMQEYVIPR